jgi:hypothetical protein
MRIWKYTILLYADRTILRMPCNSVIRKVAMQGDALTRWAEVPDKGILTLRAFRVFGTGEQIDPPTANYIGTAFDGPCVWHVYELETTSA